MQSPADTVNQLIEAINRGDLDGAAALYAGRARQSVGCSDPAEV